LDTLGLVARDTAASTTGNPQVGLDTLQAARDADRVYASTIDVLAEFVLADNALGAAEFLP
jgi:hypothetical protein